MNFFASLKSTEGVEEESIFEILDGLYQYERSSDELLPQVKKSTDVLTKTASSEGDPGWPL
jgi:hypothetical protein